MTFWRKLIKILTIESKKKVILGSACLGGGPPLVNFERIVYSN